MCAIWEVSVIKVAKQPSHDCWGHHYCYLVGEFFLLSSFVIQVRPVNAEYLKGYRCSCRMPTSKKITNTAVEPTARSLICYRLNCILNYNHTFTPYVYLFIKIGMSIEKLKLLGT